MRAGGVDWQLVICGGAVHSFTNPASGNDKSRGAAYNAKADRRSWEAMEVFFAEVLKQPLPGNGPRGGKGRWRLDEHFAELKSAARQRLGRLFNAADYPESLRNLFAVTWDFPSAEPPPYLQQLNPQLYEQECQRVQQRFDEAVKLAEEAFIAELAKLLSHLTERLSGTEDSKPKVFRDSAMGNLTEFFQRFRQLNIRSNEQLDRLVADAQGIIRGIEPQGVAR